jgi:hypothetical protein
MKKKLKPLLSQPDEEFPDAEWRFLFKEQYEKITGKDWISEFLFYELSREMDETPRRHFDPFAYLKGIMKDWFPHSPFLKLPPDLQEELIQELRKPGEFFAVHISMLKDRGIFEVSISPCLTDEASAHLEGIAHLEAESVAAKWSGSEPSHLLPLTNPVELAVNAEKNRMIEKGLDIFDPRRIRLTLLLDLEVPDAAIRNKFSELLKTIRKTKPAKDWERRGKEKDKAAPLKDLASFRLKRSCGSYRKVEEFLRGKSLDESPIPGESGWNKAVIRGEAMVAEFKERFGALAEVRPDADTRNLKS